MFRRITEEMPNTAAIELGGGTFGVSFMGQMAESGHHNMVVPIAIASGAVALHGLYRLSGSKETPNDTGTPE